MFEIHADREDDPVPAIMSSQLKLSWQLRLLSKQSRKSPPEKPECREVSAALISSCFSFLISQTLPFRIGGEQKMKRVQRRMGGVPTTKKKSTPPFFTDFLPAVRQPWGSTHSLNLCRYRTLPFLWDADCPMLFIPDFSVGACVCFAQNSRDSTFQPCYFQRPPGLTVRFLFSLLIRPFPTRNRFSSDPSS